MSGCALVGKSRIRNPRLGPLPQPLFNLLSNNLRSAIQRLLISIRISWYACVIMIVHLRMPAMARFRLSPSFMGKRPPIAMLWKESCRGESSSCRSYMKSRMALFMLLSLIVIVCRSPTYYSILRFCKINHV